MRFGTVSGMQNIFSYRPGVRSWPSVCFQYMFLNKWRKERERLLYLIPTLHYHQHSFSKIQIWSCYSLFTILTWLPSQCFQNPVWTCYMDVRPPSVSSLLPSPPHPHHGTMEGMALAFCALGKVGTIDATSRIAERIQWGDTGKYPAYSR